MCLLAISHPLTQLHRGRRSEGGFLPVVTATAVFYREPLCWTTAHGLQPSLNDGGWDTSGKLPGSGPGVTGNTSVREPSAT